MVCVIMSAYNGERYIREQLDSILDQTYRDIELIIRDDGSRDSTVDILKEYAYEYDNVSYYVGDNIGAANSFYDLLGHIPESAEYIAFSDQDDVWKPEKIERAVNRLKSVDGPALYCGRVQLVDERLAPMKDELYRRNPRISYGNAVIENICTGCTMVINRRLYNGIKNRLPKHSLMHDWWIYQVAVCFGTVIYDSTAYIYYRQHSGNVVGRDGNRISLIKRQLNSLKRFMGTYTLQLEEFIETFPLRGENRYIARLVAGTRHSAKCRFRILFERRVYRQGRFDTLLFKGMLFLGML